MTEKTTFTLDFGLDLTRLYDILARCSGDILYDTINNEVGTDAPCDNTKGTPVQT